MKFSKRGVQNFKWWIAQLKIVESTLLFRFLLISFFSEQAHVGLTDGAACGVAGVGHLRMMLATPHHIVEKIVLAMAEAINRHRS